MPKTQTNCPNCRQPVIADIEPLFDAGSDPSAKQRLLSGVSNQLVCQTCGYRGDVATNIVYHDPEKELLLTYSPPEMGLTHDEQQRRLGSLINQVVDNLPQEKRKAYLLQPQTMLTYQGLIEKVLEAEGITKEMIEGQQDRLALIQRLAEISDQDVLVEIVKQEDEKIDAEFFTILGRVTEAAALNGDRETAERLAALQQRLIPITTFGQEMEAQQKEIEAAVKDLQEVGEGLTREKLLDLIVEAPNETRVRALVSLARPGLDYQFFQLLSERIDRARGDGRSRLVNLRDQLLELTDEIDRQLEERQQQVRSLLDEIVTSGDIEQVMMQVLPVIDEFFIQELNSRINSARESGDLELLNKYQQMVEVIQKVSQTPPQIELIEELLSVSEDENQEANWTSILDSKSELVTPELLSVLANLSNQADSGEDKATAGRLKELNKVVLRYSMKKNLS